MYFPVNAALIALYQGGQAKYFTFWSSNRKPETLRETSHPHGTSQEPPQQHQEPLKSLEMSTKTTKHTEHLQEPQKNHVRPKVDANNC